MLRGTSSSEERADPRGVVRELPVRRPSDEDLVRAIRAGDRDASGLLFDRHGAAVERVLWGVLGPEPEIEDLLHEVFVRALAGIADLDDPARVKSWLFGIAVFTAREWIRRRMRRRWLRFVADVPETPTAAPDAAISEATRDTFTVLASMSEDERVLFGLRFVEGMELAEIALVCDLSLSTLKRRLKAAEKHFLARAQHHPSLAPWIREGGRWELA